MPFWDMDKLLKCCSNVILYEHYFYFRRSLLEIFLYVYIYLNIQIGLYISTKTKTAFLTWRKQTDIINWCWLLNLKNKEWNRCFLEFCATLVKADSLQISRQITWNNFLFMNNTYHTIIAEKSIEPQLLMSAN